MNKRRSPADRSLLRGLLARLLNDRAGNTIMLVAAAIAPILAMVGGAIDMSRSYLSESRLQQACDAGVLAARKKLGSAIVTSGQVPADVETAGNRFFNLNFRAGAYGTTQRDFQMALEDDYSVTGKAKVTVPTTIMKIFSYDQVPVVVNCRAKLNYSNTDVMMVLDTTGSMNDTNPGDSQPKISVLRQVVKTFHAQLEASKGAGTRIRYGFVPYSSNVNVGGLLKDEWVVKNWTYQSRKINSGSGAVSTYTYYDNFTHAAGSYQQAVQSTYAATYHLPATQTGNPSYSCDSGQPTSTSATNYSLLSTATAPYSGPPSGTKTTSHYSRVANGAYYWIDLTGTTCTVYRADYNSYSDEFDQITIPVYSGTSTYIYASLPSDVSNWRSESNGCIEERGTYEIGDYANVDLSRARDLDIDGIPSPGNAETQWRPAYPGLIYERSLDQGGNGSFTPAPVVTTDDYLAPSLYNGLVACPAAARKLAEMTPSDVSNYVDSLVARGATYHDIGMIWGGRLLSPTGLFADENADISGKGTSRHMIFLTDGLTAPQDLVYGAYGVEPLDRRRWSSTSALTLTQTVENRFTVACNEVKKRNVTVWLIGFGTGLNPVLTQCAGAGHYFEATNASQLNQVFSQIAAAMGDLRITK